MTRTHVARALASRLVLVGLSIAMTALVVLDLATDERSGTSGFHTAVEGTLIAFGIAAAIGLARRARELAREARDLREHAHALTADLDASRLEAARWKRDTGDLIAGLGAAIDRQLERWGLSPAEKEIALLLLKGLSHKEIAAIREVGETTVRQQARAIYRKAGLSGRHDLAAFFLEDLLDPATAGDHPRATPPA